MQAVLHKDLANPHYTAWLRFLKSTEDWSADQIHDYQLQELRRVVRLAYEQTEGYRKLWDQAGFSPSQLRTLADVQRIPFVTKEMLQADVESFSLAVGGARKVSTGGSSTGIPFWFYRSDVAFSKELASKAHQYHRVGWQEGHRQFVLRGIPITTESHLQYVPEFHELRASSFHLTSEQMETYWTAWLDYKPEWLRCYPSTGCTFASYLRDRGFEVPKLKGILCASENLFRPQKELLAQVFGCRPFSHYGHSELAVLAGYCEYADTYHVLPQYGYAELIDEDGNVVETAGRIGEIVATSFIMDATLFVRYRIGDVATFDSHACSQCGRPYQVWRSIEGRKQEFFVTKTGKMVSATAAIAAIHDDIWDYIAEFQFYQEAVGSAEFRFVSKDGCSSTIIDQVRNKLESRFNHELNLTMVPVSKIERTKRAKGRILIQKLDLDAIWSHI